MREEGRARDKEKENRAQLIYKRSKLGLRPCSLCGDEIPEVFANARGDSVCKVTSLNSSNTYPQPTQIS